jgi:activating signal cointegrator complex subunit 3
VNERESDLTSATQLPVRHNEELTNAELAKACMWAGTIPAAAMDSPHTKASLLLQTHFARGDLPVSDYVTDTKSVLDQAVRILQAMVDVSAEFGYADTTINAVHLLQMVYQGRWDSDSPLMMLPHVDASRVSFFGEQGIRDLMRQAHAPKARDALAQRLNDRFGPRHADDILAALTALPMLEVSAKVRGAAARPGDECALEVSLHIRNGNGSAGKGQAQAKGGRQVAVSRLQRSAPEDWVLVVVQEDDDAAELLALTRVAAGRRGATLSVHIPDDLALPPGADLVLTLYVLSVNYLGLDQSVKVRVPMATA